MDDVWRTVLTFLCGAGGLALLNIMQSRWQWRADRKAAIEDKAEEREDKLEEIRSEQKRYIKNQEAFNEELLKRVEKLEDQCESQNEGMKYVLLDRILYLGRHYINDGAVSFDDRKRLGDMHSVYHKRLEGNGDADAVMDGVYNLPLK